MSVDFSEEFENLNEFYRQNERVQLRQCKESHKNLVEAMQVYLDHHNEYLDMTRCSEGLASKMRQLYEQGEEDALY